MVDCCNDGETAMLYALNTDYAYDIAIVDRILIIDGLTIIKSMRRKRNIYSYPYHYCHEYPLTIGLRV